MSVLPSAPYDSVAREQLRELVRRQREAHHIRKRCEVQLQLDARERIKRNLAATAAAASAAASTAVPPFPASSFSAKLPAKQEPVRPPRVKHTDFRLHCPLKEEIFPLVSGIHTDEKPLTVDDLLNEDVVQDVPNRLVDEQKHSTIDSSRAPLRPNDIVETGNLSKRNIRSVKSGPCEHNTLVWRHLL
ncbi:unnamed protein product [Protopolystoma xenopodis]|uniref:Uncharacterized protein n=1 Tax=Protopolystoma xenopodis TaxID=117903 RepID=A0A448WTA9_9PLAT|nr:unnamed protein product [Protopolystoma xenopodis]